MDKDVNKTTVALDPAAEGSSKADFELPLQGFKGTPEEIERQWFEKVYKGRGDTMLQLSWRTVSMGSVLGGALSLTNLYIGLKAGWSFGVAITACILSYAIWSGLFKIGLAKTNMTILENNCMQSTASSAGTSTSGVGNYRWRFVDGCPTGFLGERRRDDQKIIRRLTCSGIAA